MAFFEYLREICLDIRLFSRICVRQGATGTWDFLKKGIEYAVPRIAKYIGNRDRPYLQDIIQTLLEEHKEGAAAKAPAAN